MEMTWLVLAVLNVLIWGALTLIWVPGIKTMPRLRDVGQVQEQEPYPLLSVVVPACNEERGIRAAVESMLGQDYPNLELIIINDRSTDRTGEILDQLQEMYPQLRVIHNRHLPEGWLGKNHALYRGAQEAQGKWLLFADGDVVCAPECFRYAVGYAEREALDHLTLVPDFVGRTPIMKAFMSTFLVFLGLTMPWRVKDPKTKHHIGIGAFNLLRADAYRAVGMHEPIAMRPDDDIKLGKLVKLHGLKQEALFGTGLIAVEWYEDLKQAVYGLEKNQYAVYDYKVGKVIGSVVGMVVINLVPFAGVWLARGVAPGLFAAAILCFAVMFWRLSKVVQVSWRDFVLYPLMSLVFMYILIRSVAVVIKSGGIDWRGTRYPLEQLKRNVV